MAELNKFQFYRGHESDYEDDGPYCANCSDDMEEVMEWQSRDRTDLPRSKKVPCKGCGAV